jgi:hypothetical protein
VSAPLRLRHLVGTAAVPIVEARLDKDWDCARGHHLLVVDECPFCSVAHYYMTWALWHPAGGAIGQVVEQPRLPHRRCGRSLHDGSRRRRHRRARPFRGSDRIPRRPHPRNCFCAEI